MPGSTYSMSRDHPSPILGAVAAIDAAGRPTSVGRIRAAIRKAIPADLSLADLSPEERAEVLAFELNGNDREDRDTYYGPSRTFRFDNGESHEWPRLADVTPEAIEYWAQRTTVARHALLRARYADLVWDLSRAISGQRASIECARGCIDSTIEVAAMGLEEVDGLVAHQLRRALQLALSVSDEARQRAVVDSILTYDAGADTPGSRRPWGFAFELLLLEQKRLLIEPKLRDELLRRELARFERYVAGDMSAVDAINAERIAMRLVQFYRKVGAPEGVRRILRAFGSAFVGAMRAASAIVASSQLQRLYEMYVENGMMEDARTLEHALRERGAEAVGELRPITITTSLSAEEIQAVALWISEGGFDASLARFWRYFLPDKERVLASLKEQVKDAPLQYLITQTIVDRAGNPLAIIPSIDEDPSGRLVLEVANHMTMMSPLLTQVARELRKDRVFTLEAITECLCRSPAFPDDAAPVLQAGLRAYFAEDYIVAICVLIPQIESGIREIAARLRASVFKPVTHQSGGRLYRALDDLLREAAVRDFLGESETHYLRVLLTDLRGWNVRNAVCHGLHDARAFDAAVADRVFHVLTLLGRIRREESA